MYFIMLQRRDDWGVLCFYRYGKAYKTLNKAQRRAKQLFGSYIVDTHNICRWTNDEQTEVFHIS